MTPDQFQRVKSLFERLEPVPADERRRLLEAGCPDDPVVRAEVERLLRPDDDADRHLDDVTRQMEDLLSSARQSSDATPAAIPDGGGQCAGPYRILKVLGRGGMGVVYLAQDMRLGRKAALKAVLPGQDQDGSLLERLRREARVLASFSHPNLATVYGLEESGDTFFIALEFIEGRTLSQHLGRGALPIPEALDLCEQIACGLEAAHERGVIHRDLKPCNVMLTADGTAKVLDFGLARQLGDPVDGEPAGPALTRQGWVFGTPAYMSPEQARGEALDPRTDIFSFGCILFRCLTGKPAFEGEGEKDLMQQILTHEPDWFLLPPKVPPAVASIVKRCLQKDRAERYQHVGDVRLDLRDARLAKAWERRDRRLERSPLVLRALPWVVALAAIALYASRYVPGLTRPRQASAPARRFDVAFPDDAVQGDLERVQVALSRDGRNLVVAAKTRGEQALWSRSHSDGQWRRVEQSEGAHRPFISPDGQWVAFFRAGHLYKRRVGGRGDPIHLAPATNWYGATWADDGSLVYCAAWGDSLQVIGPGESTPRACTRLDPANNEVTHISPTAVPGSRWVLYNVWTGGEHTDLHATHLDTGEEHVVATNASTARAAATPRGDYLLFERASTVFAAPFDRRTAKTTGEESAVADGAMNDGTRFATYFDVGADGTLVYVPGTSFAEESRLAYVNPDGTTTPLNDDRMSFCEPVFFPDGKKLSVLVKGKVYRSLVYNLERNTREFVVTGGDTLSVAVSPDGGTFACTVNRNGGYGIDLFSLADGRRIGRIVQPGADYESDLSWSTDGTLIAFSMSPHEGTPSDVWLVEPRVGARPRALVHTPGADTKPAFRPSGKWLAYMSDVSGRAETYLVAWPDGETTRQVSFGGGTRPNWSPDGKTLYYVAPQGLVSVSVAADGTVTDQPKVVYDKPFGQSDPIAREYIIAPDGRPLIVEPSERRPTVSRLNVVTDWYQLLP